MGTVNLKDLNEIRPMYRIEDRRYIRNRIRVGTKFFILKKTEDGIKRKERYTIVQKFRYHASCINRYGQRRSFDYFTLDGILNEVS